MDRPNEIGYRDHVGVKSMTVHHIRTAERLFVRGLVGNPPKLVLDVGCGKFPLKWWRHKSFECWGVDVHSVSKDKYFRQEDARQMSFPSEFFDVVYATSTIEHIGIGRYGDKITKSGDREAILEMGRVLKPNGVMLVTVPFGKSRNWPKRHRVYDNARLKKLFSGFKIVKQEYWIRRKGNEGWRRSNAKEIMGYKHKDHPEWLGNVHLVVKKQELFQDEC